MRYDSDNQRSFFTTIYEHGAKLFKWIFSVNPHINPLRKVYY